VLGSLLATRYLVPPFMPEKAAPTRLHTWLAQQGERAWRALLANRRIAIVVPIVAIAISAAGLSRLELLDDLRAMNQSDPVLLAEDRAVRARIAQGEAGRLVISMGADDEEALARNDEAYAALTEAVAAGELERFRSAHPVLPSAARQRAVDAAVRSRASLGVAMLDALARAGFVREMFAPFAESLVEPAPPPIDFAAFDATPAGVLARPFRIHAGDRMAYVSFVEGVHDGAALADRLRRIDGVRYFDQTVFLTSAYRTFRGRTTQLIFGGLFVVLALCFVKYRKASLAIASVAPAILAATTSVALVALTGQPLNLMHLVACLLVLSMGEDYAVFLLEVRDDEEGPGVTLVGLAIAGVTTILSFGLLALSAHPALRALGVVTSLGVLFSMLFAPLALLFVRRSAA
jgi:predicted exporter